jgi:uncharacterized protein (TIGR03118 family)
MRKFRHCLILAGLIGAVLISYTTARARGETDSDTVGPTVLITDLVGNHPSFKDGNGITHTPLHTDPNLQNPWGVGESSGSPFWVSDNNGNVSTLYNSEGAPQPGPPRQPLVVSIPTPGHPLEALGTPTGLVFNIDGGMTGGFKISGVNAAGNPASASAVFLFSTEDGTILGWNPGVNPPGFDPAKAGTYAIIAVDNSANPDAANGAVYKGLAIAKDSSGNFFLYATNFRSGTVEVYNPSFTRVTDLPPGAFTDPHLKRGYAPFNVALIGDKLFVTYAVQDADRHDDVAGPARGFVNKFNLDGTGLERFAQHGHLNSPWGVVQAPASFDQNPGGQNFAGSILIGNFGDGRINAFDSNTGEFRGPVVNSNGQPILIDGLWTLRVGNGGNGGDANKIYFTAGPNGESDGLFGSLTPVAPGTPCGVPCI